MDLVFWNAPVMYHLYPKHFRVASYSAAAMQGGGLTTRSNLVISVWCPPVTKTHDDLSAPDPAGVASSAACHIHRRSFMLRLK